MLDILNKELCMINYTNIVILVFLKKRILLKMLFLYYLNNNSIFEIKDIILANYYSKFFCSKCCMSNYSFTFNENVEIFQCEYCSAYNIPLKCKSYNHILDIDLKYLKNRNGITSYRLDI